MGLGLLLVLQMALVMHQQQPSGITGMECRERDKRHHAFSKARVAATREERRRGDFSE